MKTIEISEIHTKINSLREEADKLEQSLNHVIKNVPILDSVEQDIRNYVDIRSKVETKKQLEKTRIQEIKEESVLKVLKRLPPIFRHFKNILIEYSSYPSPTSSEAKSLRKVLDIMLEEGTLKVDKTGKAHIYSIVKN